MSDIPPARPLPTELQPSSERPSISDRLAPPSPEAIQAQAFAERREALVHRVDRAQKAFREVSGVYARNERTTGAEGFHDMVDTVARAADRAEHTGEATPAYSHIDLRLAVSGDAQPWEAMNKALGTECPDLKSFQALLRSDIPKLPRPSAHEPRRFYDDTYLEDGILYLPTIDKGVLMTVTCPDFDRLRDTMDTAGHTTPVPPVTIGVVMSPDSRGFHNLPDQVRLQQQRAEAARQHPALRHPQAGPRYEEPPVLSPEEKTRAELGGFLPGDSVYVRRSAESGGGIDHKNNWHVVGKSAEKPGHLEVDEYMQDPDYPGDPSRKIPTGRYKDITPQNLRNTQLFAAQQESGNYTQALPPTYYNNPPAAPETQTGGFLSRFRSKKRDH